MGDLIFEPGFLGNPNIAIPWIHTDLELYILIQIPVQITVFSNLKFTTKIGGSKHQILKLLGVSWRFLLWDGLLIFKCCFVILGQENTIRDHQSA